MIFHILGIEHTATTKEYTSCAFTQKVFNLCKMLKMSGHTVIHYGNEGSNPDCDEQVDILKKGQYLKHHVLYDHDKQNTQHLVTEFHNSATGEIAKRKEQHDFLLCPWSKHADIAKRFPDLITIESGICYASTSFTPYAVFESYAIMHACYGSPAVTVADKHKWYWRVIPNLRKGVME